MVLIEEIDERKVKPTEPQKKQQPVQHIISENNPELVKGYATIMSFALYTVHFTLSGLAYKQYAQDFSIKDQLIKSLPAIPVCYILMRSLHPFKTHFQQLVGTLSSVLCGGYLLYLVNNEGYYTTITKVPSLGTLWIWLFIELEWYSGVASLLLTLGYAHLHNLSIY